MVVGFSDLSILVVFDIEKIIDRLIDLGLAGLATVWMMCVGCESFGVNHPGIATRQSNNCHAQECE